ncbi:hypothetical protein RJT34_10451 [Clitoria ternatea]|uniref:Protein BIG GRAIN 1-like B n=1 Tax=Clitoria ternatea TaxID=43366 RepID=A0AAN9K811_CLITE
MLFQHQTCTKPPTFLYHNKTPSFSSTLLDNIYRSIDQPDSEKTPRKQNKQNRVTMEKNEEADLTAASIRRLQNWMHTKTTTENVATRRAQRKHNDHEHDVMFFSSTSTSSDSSSGLLSSSSDTESMHGTRSRVSCFAPSRPKPVKTNISVTSEKKKKKKTHIEIEEETLVKSKSSALKIYNNLKKVKQPISPGGKLTNFLNSLFTTGNSKKPKTASSSSGGQASATCSSASSFSRSCLSVTSPSSRDKFKLRDDGVKRTVRFYPVSVIVGEDSRPCGHKCLYEENEKDKRSGKKKDEFGAVDKSKRVEEVAREFLKEYRRNQNRSDLVFRDFAADDDDDAASCASSDLFELDHLLVMGDDRYCEELPVYETTHVGTNRAIANGLIM